MGIVDRIKDIEEELSKTQKHKGTERHVGILKSKLAKLRSQLLDPTGGGGGAATKGEGFAVKRSGDARIALIGFPSVGKSTLLSTVTDTKSEAAAYEFTTLTCIAGVINYRDCNLQLLDLPGIIEGAAHGQGRGREVIAVAKSADLVLMVLDAGREREQQHRRILTRELETVGLRLNREPPDITFVKKKGGGVVFNHTVPLTRLGDEPRATVAAICREYKAHDCEVMMRGDYGVDELIDVLEGNRRYVRCLYVYNKIDTTSIEHVDALARADPRNVPIACAPPPGLGIAQLLERVWSELGLVRVYTKRSGVPLTFDEPLVLTAGRRGVTVRAACEQLHRDLLDNFKYAKVWGTSVKHSPQTCGLGHVLHDEDVLQVVKKTADEERQAADYSDRVQQHRDKIKSKKGKSAVKLKFGGAP